VGHEVSTVVSLRTDYAIHNSLSAAMQVYRLVSVFPEVQDPLGYPIAQVPETVEVQETVQVDGRMDHLRVGSRDCGPVKACDLFGDPCYSDYSNRPPGRGLAVLRCQVLELMFIGELSGRKCE
jgi:hypothetical protein